MEDNQNPKNSSFFLETSSNSQEYSDSESELLHNPLPLKICKRCYNKIDERIAKALNVHIDKKSCQLCPSGFSKLPSTFTLSEDAEEKQKSKGGKPPIYSPLSTGFPYLTERQKSEEEATISKIWLHHLYTLMVSLMTKSDISAINQKEDAEHSRRLRKSVDKWSSQVAKLDSKVETGFQEISNLRSDIAEVRNLLKDVKGTRLNHNSEERFEEFTVLRNEIKNMQEDLKQHGITVTDLKSVSAMNTSSTDKLLQESNEVNKKINELQACLNRTNADVGEMKNSAEKLEILSDDLQRIQEEVNSLRGTVMEQVVDLEDMKKTVLSQTLVQGLEKILKDAPAAALQQALMTSKKKDPGCSKDADTDSGGEADSIKMLGRF